MFKFLLATILFGAGYAFVINIEIPSGHYHAEDTQVLGNVSNETRARAFIDPNNPDEMRWPGGIVYYKITGSFSEDQLYFIKHAQFIISNRSDNCIQFREATDEKDHLVFTKTQYTCSSNVGRQGGAQYMELCDDCFDKGFGSIAHELMHVIGFHHEHVRDDRDAYITVHESLIIPDKRHDFEILDVEKLNLPYDYESILHYPRVGFGINGYDETITPRDPSANIGQRERLSDIDVAKIKNYYGCD